MREKEKDPVILVTKDLLLRLKAQLLGIQAEDFEAEQVEEQKLQYTGRMKYLYRKSISKILRKREYLSRLCIKQMSREKRFMRSQWAVPTPWDCGDILSAPWR